MKKLIFPLVLVLSLMTSMSAESVFQPQFDSIIENQLYARLLSDGPGDWGFQLDTASTNQMIQALVAMSNHVDEAVAMLPTVLTNDLRREVFFNMAGYAGTNTLFQLWNGLLDIAETNATLCPASNVEWFWAASTTPLEDYVVFNYNISISQSLLTRTRNLFSPASDAYQFLNTVLSGEERERKRAYLIDSGERLPPFAIEGN